MVLKRSTVGRFTATFSAQSRTYDVRDINMTVGATVAPSFHSGLRENTGVLVSRANENMATFTMGLDQALTIFGTGVTEWVAANTCEIVLGNVIGSTIDTNNTHTKWAKATDCIASGWIDSFTAREGSEATASIVVKWYSDDGIQCPVEATGSVAFPALTAIPEIHTIGPVTINATAIPGVTGIDYRSGFTTTPVVTDGLVYAQGCVPSSFDRRISLTMSDPVGLESVLGDIGVEITTTTTVVLYKSVDTIPSASGAITLTIARGFAMPTAFSGNHGGEITGGIEIIPSTDDGLTVGIVVS